MATVYDPLGMIAPFMLPAKLLLQSLANEGLDWDTEISASSRVVWEKWLNGLPHLNEISMPRVYEGISESEKIELHCFADASRSGFGAVCYLRTIRDRNYACSFIIGKSKVAPKKQLSIPRLELCAAVVATRLARLVVREHGLVLERVVFWSDSTTVLAYLRDTSKRRPAFETHRIKLIRKLTDIEDWRWVDTQQNPADLYSRGLSPRHAQRAAEWLQAPQFLLRDEPS